jgi:hypothetical protein
MRPAVNAVGLLHTMNFVNDREIAFWRSDHDAAYETARDPNSLSAVFVPEAGASQPDYVFR